MKSKIESTIIRDITITEKSHIHVSRSVRDGATPCCDIRLFNLIPINGNYDGTLKATPKGLHFTIDRLPDVICALIDFYEDEYGIEFDKFEAENMIAARTSFELVNSKSYNEGSDVDGETDN